MKAIIESVEWPGGLASAVVSSIEWSKSAQLIMSFGVLVFEKRPHLQGSTGVKTVILAVLSTSTDS
jgi:hypothetical protein